MLSRYTDPAMWMLWGEPKAKFDRWLKVELVILKAKVDMGLLPERVYRSIFHAASFDLSRIDALEREYNHDMLAFIGAVQESLERADLGQYAGEFHKGVTSYDIEDPAAILMLRDANILILERMEELEKALREKASSHRYTLMIARTHGQFAEPTTFGHFLLVFAEAVHRSIVRLENAELNEAKISGAVGSYAGMDPELEIRALRYLELVPAKAETQILQRDRHAAYLADIAIAASTIEQMCRTFWEMMRSEVGELEEQRGPRQRGSSAMPQKKNPILTEQLMGLPRLLRGYSGAAMENIATPEGRDISQSSVERHIFPDATSLLHYMAIRATKLVYGLVVHKGRMRENLEEGTLGVWAGQQIKIALLEEGVDPDAAYECVQKAAFDASETKCSMLAVLGRTRISAKDPRIVVTVIGEKRLTECFNALNYVRGGIDHIFGRESSNGDI